MRRALLMLAAACAPVAGVLAIVGLARLIWALTGCEWDAQLVAMVAAAFGVLGGGGAGAALVAMAMEAKQ